ncbi:sigma-70 family RNA polymerase sigma factor [Roseibacillus ishigakijimensis]|uniref:Sigma-70 family RNA polymerase sigma factor n=1 Tax=Roseibacillus ishigakijimensis TaxID=454146 RepID=A0A934RQE9_9BACT|nr:sigma-70 family RNA polymerase sigma factor [Roseibacillus ishigakijimensis]MBK1832626.1 sigma-70 family RNA polymerase sigma factor [Roseibacillus ishigakijimensis]
MTLPVQLFRLPSARTMSTPMPNHDDSSPTDTSRGELFSQLLVGNRHRIYGFIYSLLHDHQQSEDLMQEVSTILWRKFDQFEEGTDFAAWAMSVARFCALNWRRKQARVPLALEEDDLMRLADDAAALGCSLDDRRDDLEVCLGRLPNRCRQAVWFRYQEDLPVKDIAKKQRVSIRSIYLLLEKAHGMLLDCMNRRQTESAQANQ